MNRRIFLLVASSLFGVTLSAPDAPAANDLLARLSGRGASADDELLPPDRAFAVSIAVRDANTVVATFTPVPGHYLYRDKFAFRVRTPADIRVASVDLPSGAVKDDPYFGKTETFDRAVQATIRLDRTNRATSHGPGHP